MSSNRGKIQLKGSSRDDLLTRNKIFLGKFAYTKTVRKETQTKHLKVCLTIFNIRIDKKSKRNGLK